MFVIVCWALVALFWGTVGVNAYINKSETRKARREQLIGKILFPLFDAYEWVRVKVFRRQPSFGRADANVLALQMLERAGVRAVWIEMNGQHELLIHPDDRAAFDAFLATIKQNQPV